MASIRDYAVTINVTATASMVCEMPTHATGDVILAFLNKDAATAFTAPAGWDEVRIFAGTGEYSGIWVHRAASSSDTAPTFTLAIDQCNAVLVSVKDAEAAVDSGAGALQINVVAAGLTYTRTTGSFTTDGFSVGQSVLMSGFTNAGNNGIKEIVSITGSGTILTVTSAATLVNETGNNNERVISTGLDKSSRTAANDSTVPYGGATLTPVANNTLLLHLLGGDAISAPSPYPGWINLFSGDNAASSISVSYSFQKTAGAITGPNSWSLTEDDTTAFMVAVRDSGSLTTVPAYIAPGTTPAVMISPLVMVSGNIDKGTWELVTNDITTLAGKTLTQLDPVSAADSGYNPFRSAVRVVAASSTTALNASEMRFASAPDLTAQAGVVFGTFRPQVPRDYLDAAKPANGGGAIIMFADAENDYKAWIVAAQFSKTTDPSNRGNYAIQVQGSSDTSYGTSGTIAWSAINDLYLAGSGYFGACSFEWSELYLLNETQIVGGSATTPAEFDEIVRVINNGSGFIPLAQQFGAVATLWTRIRFGGAEATFTNVNLRTFQYPKKADEIDYLDFHVDNNHMGIEFYGLSGDSLTFTNCVFTSDSSYYWRFNSSHSGSSTIDFSGSSVVNATITLRSTVTLDNITFIDCGTFTQNAATITNSTFSNTVVTSASPTDMDNISDCSFISDGTGHAFAVGSAIAVPGSPLSITFSGNTFTSFASTDGSTGNEAIHILYTSGTLTINIADGGSTPSIRTGGATVVVQNAVTVKVTVKDANTLDPIETARVLLEADSVATGTHTGSNNASTLTDGSQTFTIDALIGYRIYNTTDGSDGLITDNDATTVTATLAGGTQNDWDTSDAYIIVAKPALNPVSITRSGSTATVTHRNHGLASGASVVIRGTTQDEYIGTYTISNVSTNAYDYAVTGTPATPATGSPTSTAVILSGETGDGTPDPVGVIQTTTFNYTIDQPVIGKARRATTGTKYKTGTIPGTITSEGLDVTVLLIIDE